MKRGLKVLFGVGSDHWIRFFIDLAKSMPDVECMFVGFDWSAGLKIRNAGFDFAYVPLYCKTRPAQAIPSVMEFRGRGYLQETAPVSARKAYTALADLIESVMSRFTPDIVVYGGIEMAVSYLVDTIASRRGVTRLGLQTSFVSNHYLIQPYGSKWIEHFQHIEISRCLEDEKSNISRPEMMVSPRRLDNNKGRWDLHHWMLAGERVIRVLIGGITFDTLPYLVSLSASKVASGKWFPRIQTLKSINDVHGECVLVALNQPILCSWNEPELANVIDFAIQATPEAIPIVIRPHPHEIPVRLPRNLEKELLSRNARISRPGSGPNLETLIQRSRAVITMNSAIGIEALLRAKPVFALASAFYVRPGMARAVSLPDAPMTREMIENANDLRPNPAEVKQFVNWLTSNYMVPSSFPDMSGTKVLADLIRAKLSPNVMED